MEEKQGVGGGRVADTERGGSTGVWSVRLRTRPAKSRPTMPGNDGINHSTPPRSFIYRRTSKIYCCCRWILRTLLQCWYRGWCRVEQLQQWLTTWIIAYIYPGVILVIYLYFSMDGHAFSAWLLQISEFWMALKWLLLTKMWQLPEMWCDNPSSLLTKALSFSSTQEHI